MRVSQERTLEGRIFQIAGAAERKPRAPNEMLQRVTERRLVEVDHKSSAWIVPLDQIRQIRGVTSMYGFMGHCGNFEFNTVRS